MQERDFDFPYPHEIKCFPASNIVTDGDTLLKSISDEAECLAKLQCQGPLMFGIDRELDRHQHHFRTVKPIADNWLQLLAERYVQTRSSPIAPIDPEVFDGLEFDVATVRQFAERAVLPVRVRGPLCIVRSDFGETIGLAICETLYATQFGWIGIRDRALNQQPGGGIDSVGIEGDSNDLQLVLLEVKVSSEQRNGPPQVVETSNDSLRVQHLKSIAGDSLVSKVVRATNSSRDSRTTSLLMVAAARLTKPPKRKDKLKLVCVSVLVRPESVFRDTDFGTFRTSPNDFSPASLRFIVPLVGNDLEQQVDDWFEKVQLSAGGDE